MNPLTWVLVGVALFWVVALGLRARGYLPNAVQLYGPLVTLHTKRGRRLIDRIAAPKRAWRAWGNFGLGIALVVMVGALLFFVLAAVATLQNPPAPSALNNPRTALVIPGYNPFLPWSVAPEILLGLIIGLVVHEGGHGILCRVEDIEIESLGLLFLTVIPAGAFVEPDEESQQNASRGARSRMFAAGVTNNFAVTVVAFALLFGPVVGSLGVVSGAAVMGSFPGSPADTASIGQGDVIVSVANQSVTSEADLHDTLATVDSRTVTVGLANGETRTLTRSVLVSAVVQGGPVDLREGATIAAVNGTRVNTTGEFERAVRAHPVARLTTADGNETVAPMGAYVQVRAGYALAEAGAPTGDAVVTRIDGQRVSNASALSAVLDGTDPGQTVTVELHTGDGVERYDVTLGESPDGSGGFLGVYLIPGTSGLSVTDVGVQTYPAGQYLAALGGSCEGCRDVAGSFVQRTLLALQFPVVGVVSTVFPYNFAGFTGPITNFYVAEGGPLSFLGTGALFLLANVLFWTGWLNLNLGVFNCIPTFMLDGGHMFRTAAQSVAARLPVGDRRQLVRAATVGVQLLMFGSLILVLFGAQLLN